jgi:hypothetical protein
MRGRARAKRLAVSASGAQRPVMSGDLSDGVMARRVRACCNAVAAGPAPRANGLC